LHAGADIVVLRHPRSMAAIGDVIAALTEGV